MITEPASKPIRKRWKEGLQHRQYEKNKELSEHEIMETCHSRDAKYKDEPENEQNMLFSNETK